MPEQTKYRIESASEPNSAEKTLNEHADNIARHKQQESFAYFLIGKLLLAVKILVGHGLWIEFLRDPRVGFKEDTAQSYMLLGRAPDGAELARLGIAKAKLLLARKRNLQERAAFIAAHRPADLTVAQLEELLPVERRPRKAQPDKRQEAYEQGREAGRAEQQADEYQRGFRAGYEQGKAHASSASRPMHHDEWAAGILYLKPNELTKDSVVRAYRELAMVLHPDKALVTNLALMQRLNEAKDYFVNHRWDDRTAVRPE